MISVKEIMAARALSKSGLPELDYSLNPYLGCLHACRYCFAVDFTSDREARESWGKHVAVRSNIASVLGREVVRMPRGLVGISTITDAYQPVEGKYRLTRQSIKLLLENGFRITVQTKSPLVRRDLDILSGYRGNSDVGITLTCLSRDKSDLLEPGAPSPDSRVRALEELSYEKINSWIFYGPIVRGFNDDPETVNGIVEISRALNSRIIFDRYASYHSAEAMMVASGFDRNSLSHDSRWWSDVSARILEEARKRGVMANSQSEEWKNTTSLYQQKLF